MDVVECLGGMDGVNKFWKELVEEHSLNPIDKEDLRREIGLKKLGDEVYYYLSNDGTLNMTVTEDTLTEDELAPLVTAWREASPNIVKFWWEVDRAAKSAVFNKETTKVRNIRKYLLAALFNAPATMEGYYKSEVNCSLYGSSERNSMEKDYSYLPGESL